MQYDFRGPDHFHPFMDIRYLLSGLDIYPSPSIFLKVLITILSLIGIDDPPLGKIPLLPNHLNIHLYGGAHQMLPMRVHQQHSSIKIPTGVG
jgi:hypothetical protein